MNYYNEFDPFAAQWLRELIADGLLPPGDVDDRSIVDVRGADLRGYVQCHFFAGVGGWPYALRLAGWPDDRPAWTGSCPCQPFSVAGTGAGTHDERHLWPEFRRLIRECRPQYVFGEQVGGEAGELWLAGVQLDLEADAYRFGAAGLCAAGVGAPHIRSRLYWLGHADLPGREARDLLTGRAEADGGAEEARREPYWLAHTKARGLGTGGDERREGRGSPREGGHPEQRSNARGLAHATDFGYERGGGTRGARQGLADDGTTRWLGNTEHPEGARHGRHGRQSIRHQEPGGHPETSPWRDFALILCGDGKTRRIPAEPSLFPLVDGPAPGRVGILRGAGNAIVAPLAAEFVAAYMDIDGAA